jgi:cytochrome c-type biogenesis protein CcmH
MNFLKIFLAFFICIYVTSSYPNQNNINSEKRFIELSSELRCLVCQNQSLLDSDSELANDLKEIIYEKINEGQSNNQIKSFLVERYGEFILFKPLFNMANLLLWVTPLISFIFIAFIAIRKTNYKEK